MQISKLPQTAICNIELSDLAIRLGVTVEVDKQFARYF